MRRRLLKLQLPLPLPLPLLWLLCQCRLPQRLLRRRPRRLLQPAQQLPQERRPLAPSSTRKQGLCLCPHSRPRPLLRPLLLLRLRPDKRTRPQLRLQMQWPLLLRMLLSQLRGQCP